ncbi:MAG: aminoacetone oxidase family FAD-binding enzyme [Atopobium sp.]|uniref:aminoacetone oxidase family FAD-binding enzyme n=1 Tax=Atopobium sp. TaxID=1872650 RepID=UPI002A81E379|nr:aminoacetone oxidase family FAD-binding enzyme [Atopobium sp.]MDY4522019.1 aminoacetone oxidase family FAD-binding enzyme [Atopobium sp.]
MKLAIIGGGAAGFFLAINAKEKCPDLDVTIFEQHNNVLLKLGVSGGGRCNCTNTFAQVTNLKQVYPRGAMLLKKLFKQFGPQDVYAWLEAHGVPLMIQPDQRVFPKAQDSHALIDCFTQTAQQLGVQLLLGQHINDPKKLLRHYGGTFDFVAVTTGGTPNKNGCVPSLFSFTIADAALHELAGTTVLQALLSLPKTKFAASGAVLITHKGLSGPATLTLSSYAARYLAECNYQTSLHVNWTGEKNMELVRGELTKVLQRNARKHIHNVHPFGLPTRLWVHLLERSHNSTSDKRCDELSKKDINHLVQMLTACTYQISGRSSYKEEFVTCGGIALDAINSTTLESKETPGLFYAGEVLDIDGITGGFNFTAAWTTAYAVAEALRKRL